MPHTTNRTHSPSNSPSSEDENTLPQSLDTSMEALIKVSVVTIFVVGHVIAFEHLRDASSQPRWLSLIFHNDDANIEIPGTGTTHWSKCQKTRNPTPTGSDDEAQDDTSTDQLEDVFVSNMGHNLCVIYAPGVQISSRSNSTTPTMRLKDSRTTTSFRVCCKKSSAFSKRSLARKLSFLRSGCAARHEIFFLLTEYD